MSDFNELTEEQVLAMDDDEFLSQWAAWEERDVLALQENLDSKSEWL